jgi:hypothetical protein
MNDCPMKIIEVSRDEVHYVPIDDNEHQILNPCLCRPQITVGALGIGVIHRPYAELTMEEA